ncbi:GH25 family lysozyme [Ligilactobacillus equi]|uniref:Glycoside hydrolase family 25 n=2 Tax=Ligilactobacillus equi TaxID=137357 RepID=V7HZE0_9LACO|nr:GH25 family lysozyme [Ligilactobacillus equi]ETA74376.1 glycoside hydrolase family 25 [Ligilactobacillus equi DPC 6820]
MAREIIVDLASYQADLSVADYKALGATKAIVKVTESTNYTNPYANREVNRAAEAGYNGFAFYHFAKFGGSVSQAVAEASYFIKQTKAKFNLSPGTLMILDAEETNQTTDAVIAFLDVVRKAGFHTGFYTYKYMLPQFNLEAIKPHMDFFWLAAYPLANGAAADRNPDFNYFPSANYVDLWQYTDNLLGYKVDGSISVTDNALKLFNPSGAKVESKPIATPAPSPKPVTTHATWTDDLSVKWTAEKGTFTLGSAINLRWGATTTSGLIATLPKGAEVEYDAWAKSGGYTWVRQPRGDGTYGYMAVRDAQGNPFGTFK